MLSEKGSSQSIVRADNLQRALRPLWGLCWSLPDNNYQF